MEFKSYPKTPRLISNVVVTEKIDGTNGVIAFDGNMNMYIGSRNRWLTIEDDNFGFCRWAKDNEEDLRKLGSGYHYGEWYGRGIQRSYGLRDRYFALFNTTKWGDSALRPSCCNIVPIIYQGQYGCYEKSDMWNAIKTLEKTGSVLVPGQAAEGAILYYSNCNRTYKLLF